MSSVAIVVRLAKVVELVLSELGLTLNQYRALTLIEAGPPQMGEFAFRLAMEPPNASALVDGLVARSLAARGRDRSDRRRVVLRLTARGRDLLGQAETRCTEGLARVASFGGAEEGALIAGLAAWGGALDAVAIDLQRRLEQGVLGPPRTRGGRRSPGVSKPRRSATAANTSKTAARRRRATRDVTVRRSIAALVSGGEESNAT